MSTTGHKVGAIREHRCDVCGKVELWGALWRWCIVAGQLDHSVCSAECELALKKGKP